ncbi:ArnT family glycosyltransferase [Sporolactobacillus kofuensis]|uniref:ArnT family glycosyltransferase n=1 Tax=Sporolactobacillus kofuensis TaxID=269672 RepID=A0ABW1WFU3_9BACL|nr:glycosyltransferase family 39 protein [Sporolactobacillus kofuensis]MCO7177120.1 glycosyltransferase family 39 protein [Sporolactobacillus kofuensis]
MGRTLNWLMNRTLVLIEKYYYIFVAIIFSILCFTLFYKMNMPNIQDWDEARHGVNAYEMLRFHNYIVNYYGSSPDYWNLKPPMSYWSIIIGYKLFGFDTLGLRFFSGLSLLLVSIILGIFVKKRFGKLASLITLASFISCVPLVLNHCGRTGDPDALFLLFFTSSIICLLKMDHKFAFLYLAGIFFSFAFLTKSWHAFSILIVICLFIIFTGKIRKLNIYQYSIFIVSSLLPILIWAIFRYHYDGLTFFKQMIQYDLLSRSSQALEGHMGGRLYYIEFIVQQNPYWTIVLFASFFGCLTIVSRNNLFHQYRNYIIGLLLWICVPLLIFSMSKTKLYWYIYPIIPALSICIGWFSAKLIKMKKPVLSITLIVLIAFSFFANEKIILQSIKSANSYEVQTLFEKMNRSPQYSKANVYLGKDLNWSQSTYLSGLLYGDVVAKDTGMKGFLHDKNKNSLLVVTKDKVNEKTITQHHYKIISSNDQYYLLQK